MSSYSNGIAQVSVGSPNYVYLGNASLALNPDFKSAEVRLTSISRRHLHVSHRRSSTTTSNHTQNALIVVAIIAVIVIALIGAIAASRRRHGQQLPQQVFSSSLPISPRFCSYCGAVVRSRMPSSVAIAASASNQVGILLNWSLLI